MAYVGGMKMREILIELMRLHGDDAYSLEAKSSVPQPTTQRFISGKHKSANENTVQRWATAYGISVSQLRGDAPLNIIDFQEIHAYSSDDTTLRKDLYLAEPSIIGYSAISNSEHVIQIPLLNIKASMGSGIDNECEHVIDMLTICKTWADRTLQPYSNNKNLSFIHAIGDSMAPTFNDGDVLMIDTGDKSIKEDKIYVIEAHGRLFIKRMRQRINGVFEISSDNPLIKTVDILNGDHEVEIKGRVIWVWNGKKL